LCALNPTILMRQLLLAATVCLAIGCSRTGLDRGTPADDDGGADAVLTDAGPDAIDIGFDLDDAEVLPDITPDLMPEIPPGVCGDGVLEGLEECDDGDFNSDEEPDGCRTNCLLAACGDGVVDSFEPCDDGNGVEADDCSNDCLRPAIPCTPCESSAECGRSLDQCSRLLDGTFCTTPCGADEQCGPGTVCRGVETTAGAVAEQCVPELDVCAGCFDQDGDTYGIGLECPDFDCDDDNPRINPGVEEICNDIDDDCDIDNDEGCPPDLIVDGEEVELSGDFLFDRVDVLNGGIIRVRGRESDDLTFNCSPDGPGCLKIRARIIFVREGSTIDASGAGSCDTGAGDEAGFGPGLANVGPGGGAYGGAGGSGPGLSGGQPYGTPDGADIEMGSPGRGFFIEVPGFDGAACDDLVGFSSAGGGGGGCVQLAAPDILISGSVLANGEAGDIARDSAAPAIVDGGAGGSGGGILLRGSRISLEAGAIVHARGGRGGTGATYNRGGDGDQCIGNGGGGGSGGRIKMFGETISNASAVDTRGGDGATGPQNDATGGQNGTVVIQ
jgi:cysteine-rich repeat protein